MQTAALFLGPLLAACVGGSMAAAGAPTPACITAAVAIWCAAWWITEPISISATALLPIAVFPFVGVLTATEVGAAYGDKLILLFLGGFILSTAMERSGAHRRLALNMVHLFHGERGGRRLVFGFMAASALLSMWISNTATALMLLPIVMAVLEGVDDPKLRPRLLLAIAYAASVGGIATPIGTPPNLVFMQAYSQLREEPSFLEWMSWALPVALVMLPLTGLWLTRGLRRGEPIRLPEVGSWRPSEARTLAVFAVTALLWITRKAPWGGWSEWFDLPQANDASVALFAVLAMFVIPNGEHEGPRAGERLLDWKTAERIPWGLLMVFSGGVVLARAFEKSGLSDLIGERLSALEGAPIVLLVAAICLLITFLTEVTSNLATATMIMPVLKELSIETGLDPFLVMFPAALSASFAFMLPVATPPNAIVFGAGGITGREMAREGFALNLVGVAVITLLTTYFLS